MSSLSLDDLTIQSSNQNHPSRCFEAPFFHIRINRQEGTMYLMFCLWDLIWHFVTQCAIQTKGLIFWFPNGVQGPFYTKRDFYKVIQQSYEPTIKRSTIEKYAICRRDYSAKNPTFLRISFMWGHFLRDDITIFLLTNYVCLGNWWWVDLNFLRLLKKQVSS